MSNVSLPIGGRLFAVSCADGEEEHIEMLGRMVDERARKIGGGQNEQRMLLFAALMMADELHELHKQAPPPGAEPGPSPVPVDVVTDPEAEQRVVDRVLQLAERIEKLAGALEQGPVSA
ncbi:cell division protein ZapA [Novosphingobium taihuense]|uniref:Cell division protein ZapA n=1 Tax=Novosphingobium taihuense TaxID=260085 RepID=A0A7W7ACT1_9SPHN|nr:cell division protein ZapA [Novosphingobium taihuense]MBB4613875.1 cell division protein ZapA [Novosphingobium taihuense]TWH83381.1 cell division protein ZapA [Novosphingobium taihuense]